MTRECTERLLEMVEEGVLDSDYLINACLSYMSEDEAKEMAEKNEIDWKPFDFEALKESVVEHFRIDSWRDNEIVEYLLGFCDELDSADEIAEFLESGHCAAGSFGADTIYTARMHGNLSEWAVEIDSALESFRDATGEDSPFGPPHPSSPYAELSCAALVAFAVDWYANEIAAYIRSEYGV